MTGQVQGKVALVTGGASGIGEAVSELLAREGASIAVTDVDDLKGPEVVARIKTAGGEAGFWHHDVTSEERWVEVVADVMKRYGRPADLGQDPGGSHRRRAERADRSGGACENGDAAGACRPRRRDRAGRSVSRVRCLALCDGDGARHRWRDECGRGSAQGVSHLIPEYVMTESAKFLDLIRRAFPAAPVPAQFFWTEGRDSLDCDIPQE